MALYSKGVHVNQDIRNSSSSGYLFTQMGKECDSYNNDQNEGVLDQMQQQVNQEDVVRTAQTLQQEDPVEVVVSEQQRERSLPMRTRNPPKYLQDYVFM